MTLALKIPLNYHLMIFTYYANLVGNNGKISLFWAFPLRKYATSDFIVVELRDLKEGVFFKSNSHTYKNKNPRFDRGCSIASQRIADITFCRVPSTGQRGRSIAREAI